MKEAEVSLEKDCFQITSEGTAEIVVVGLDQDLEPVLIEIGLDVISVGNMITLQKTDFKIGKRNRTCTTNV